MDVVRLDSNTHIPNLLIDGYESMIFTERYRGLGEFQLKTHRIRETMQDLPFYTFLSILKSREIMIVESHEIERDEHGVWTLTVSGRSYLNVLELRALYLPTQGYHNPWAMQQGYTVKEALAVYLWNLMCNATGKDVIHLSGRPLNNFMPNLAVSMIGARGTPTQVWRIAEEEMASVWVENLLDIGALSLRVVRPRPEPESYQSISVVYGSGDIIETTATDKKSRVEVYQGVDRTATVILRDDAGHFVSSRYLFSIKDHRNVASVVYSEDRVILRNPPEVDQLGYPIVNEFERRSTVIDGGQAGDDPLAYQRLLTQKGLAALQEAMPVSLFDGELSLAIPYIYNVDYALGDTVLVVSEFGLHSEMQVTEYIHVFDHTGDREYPTLMPTGIPRLVPDYDYCENYIGPFPIGTAPEHSEAGTFAMVTTQTSSHTAYAVQVAETVSSLRWLVINTDGESDTGVTLFQDSGGHHFTAGVGSNRTAALYVYEDGAFCVLYPTVVDYNYSWGAPMVFATTPWSFKVRMTFDFVQPDELYIIANHGAAEFESAEATWDGTAWEAEFPGTPGGEWAYIMASPVEDPDPGTTPMLWFDSISVCPISVDEYGSPLTIVSIRACPASCG